ncbi:hypothetical protein [Leuconostoc mesenteroides]|uniref:hypothetical protein n=1 Tax=Leuconostoc mesenteroides TaxID=1245 RepID=UPI002361CB97|nr:hypothetical protein [Leuconostoc mesenteroides]
MLQMILIIRTITSICGGGWSEKVDFYVDQYSIEVFWPNTGQVATFAKYSNDSGDNIVFDNLDNKSASLIVQEMK